MNVAFASTNYGPMWGPVVSSWLRTIGYTSRHFEVNHIGKVGGAGVTDRLYTMTAENQLVKDFLKTLEFTHLFLTESDMILPHDCIVKLAALDKDMASGVYFLRSPIPELRGQPCLFKKSFERQVYADGENEYLHTPIRVFPQDTPFQVDCSGLGCVLIKREVFEKLEQPWFQLKAGAERLQGYGSDMFFYTHARRAGFELWVDPLVQCGQIDYYETTFLDYYWQLEHNPKFGMAGYIVGLGKPEGFEGVAK